MRIGFVNTGTIQQNASTLRCLHLGKLLVRDGHDVSLFITDQPENRQRYGDSIDGIRMRYSEVGSGREQRSKIRLLLAERFDVLHCMSAGSSVHFPAWLSKWRHGGSTRLIMDFDEWQSLWLPYPKRLYQAMWERFACATSDAVIFASAYLARTLGKAVSASRRHTLPYAFDEQEFAVDSPSPELVRGRYRGRRLAVYMGNLIPQFDASRVLDAVEPAHRAHPDLLFLFIGSGPLRDEFQRRVDAEGVGEHVRFLGFLPTAEMIQHLRAADVLLLPIRDTVMNQSRSPNKLFQYVAAQRPIVTNRLENIYDAVGDEVLYFDFDSKEDFVRRIGEALRPDAPLPSSATVARHSWRARYAAYLAIIEGAPPAAGSAGPALGG
ncbi:MAG TPA: glycosyltransferase [Gemmatimonadaceae bacterium]|nr:glycosyltransferase [Gemmatimonadaceae bacterium]